MNKQELEKYKDPDNMRVTDDLHIVDLYQFTYEELERFIQSEIEAYEAAQWLPYPENKPEIYKMYWVRHADGEEDRCIAYGWDNFVKNRKIIAFRTPPKSYQP